MSSVTGSLLFSFKINFSQSWLWFPSTHRSKSRISSGTLTLDPFFASCHLGVTAHLSQLLPGSSLGRFHSLWMSSYEEHLSQILRDMGG